MSNYSYDKNIFMTEIQFIYEIYVYRHDKNKTKLLTPPSSTPATVLNNLQTSNGTKS